MRILFVTNLPHLPQAYGGARISTHESCRMLQDRGHDVGVLCALEPGDKTWAVNRLRSRIQRSRYPVGMELGYPVFRGWNPLDGIDEVVARFSPEVVVAGATRTGLMIEKLLGTDVPLAADIVTVNFDKMGGELPPDPRVTYISNSFFTANRLRERFGLESTIVRPVVIPEKYAVRTRRASILHVNPHMSKGIDVTLRLAEARPDIPFEIVEAWSETDAVRRHRQHAARLPNVAWHKPVRDMRKLYRKARIIIAPSRWEEAWGRIATEAHINGIPVLASDRGGLPESVGPGGLLVDPEADAGEWETALARLWDDRECYEAKAAAAQAYAQRPEIVPEPIIDALESTLRKHIRVTRAGAFS